jgi:peroxiredoxin
LVLLAKAAAGGSVSGSGGLWGRLLGVRAPDVGLPFAPGEVVPGSVVSLAELARNHSLVVCFYGDLVPLGAGAGEGEVCREIDGERARARGWRDYDAELGELGYQVVGVSVQSPEVQAQFAGDWLLGFTLLSDNGLLLAEMLGLPKRKGLAEKWVYDAFTLLIQDGRISRVFYPISPPEHEAAIMTASIKTHRA